MLVMKPQTKTLMVLVTLDDVIGEQENPNFNSLTLTLSQSHSSEPG